MRSFPLRTVPSHRSTLAQPAEGRPGPSDDNVDDADGDGDDDYDYEDDGDVDSDIDNSSTSGIKPNFGETTVGDV